MLTYFGIAAGTTMPTFPTLDLTDPVNWFRDGVVSIVSSNATVIIIAGIAIAGIVGAVTFARKFGKKAVKG